MTNPEGTAMRMLTGTFLLAILWAGPASSQASVRALEGISSTVLQEKQSSFSGLGLRMQVKDRRLLSNVTLLPTVEWWRNANHLEPYGIRSVRKDATLGLDARWEFTRAGWTPYLGAGYALHFVGTEVEAPSLGVPRDTYGVTKGGLAALGGVLFSPGGRLENFVELKYHHVPPYRQLKMNWGLSWVF
jgi:hypothetical protein